MIASVDSAHPGTYFVRPMQELIEKLSALAQKALQDRFGAVDNLPTPRPGAATRPEFGDLQISSAMQLAKALKKPPREIAQVLMEAVAGHAAIAKSELAGPGFVNLWLSDKWLTAHATAAAASPRLGLSEKPTRGRVVIDYSSPNVAKPMHIAHIRSTIIGESLKRILRAVGYEVIADNHLGDWGTQFGKLIVAYRRWLDADAFAQNPVEELLRLYIKFQEEEKRQGGAAKEDDGDDADTEKVTPLLAEARAELVKLQQGDRENHALWQKFIDVSMTEFNRVYKRLGVSFDVIHGESFYNDRLASTIDKMVSQKIAEESRGALVVFFRKPDGTDEMPPAIVRKADGAFNYATTDVAGALYRSETWNPARILIVVDERQQLHFKQFFTIAQKLGVTASQEHIAFGLMRLPEGTISTREGKLIGLEALLDESERRAYEVAKAHSVENETNLDEASLREIARVVGMGAVKYNDLSKDRTSAVTFTWDKALSLTGNTAPYLQYAYARIQSILRKADAEGVKEHGPIAELTPVERALVTKLLWFRSAVESVAETSRPHLLAEYLFELAGAFSTFYADHPVLKAEAAVRASRLAITDLVARTLKVGLDLLGIEVLEKM